MRRAIVLLIALFLTACATGNEALRNATLSRDAGAPGYVVVGLAEQNYRFGLVYSTQSIAVTLTSPGQEPVTARHEGCGSVGGFIATKPCDLATPAAVVLRVPPGTWDAGRGRTRLPWHRWRPGDHRSVATCDIPASPR